MSTWQVVRVPDPGRWGTFPAEGILGVRDLPEAVARIGLKPGDPVFVRPEGMVDEGLLDFVRSNSFRNLERESKRNYSTDIRVLLDFLSSRDIEWWKATQQDLDDFRDWRCDAPGNSDRISGTKWDREVAAFTKLFRWGKVRPLPVDVSRREDRAADSVSSRVSWLTPRTWGLWSDIGLRGHNRSGLPEPGWDSRTEIRNTSFVQLLLSSALRRQEGGSLLTFELPTQRLRHGRYCHGRIAGAVTRSKNSRVFYASVDAVGQVEAYVQSERAWAVQRAQVAGRYERLPAAFHAPLTSRPSSGRAQHASIHRQIGNTFAGGLRTVLSTQRDPGRNPFMNSGHSTMPTRGSARRRARPYLRLAVINAIKGASYAAGGAVVTAAASLRWPTSATPTPRAWPKCSMSSGRWPPRSRPSTARARSSPTWAGTRSRSICSWGSSDLSHSLSRCG